MFIKLPGMNENEIQRKLENMKQVRILCWIEPLHSVSRQLHHFSDASEVAYGVVSYLRSLDDQGHVTSIFFIMHNDFISSFPDSFINISLQSSVFVPMIEEISS